MLSTSPPVDVGEVSVPVEATAAVMPVLVVSPNKREFSTTMESAFPRRRTTYVPAVLFNVRLLNRTCLEPFRSTTVEEPKGALMLVAAALALVKITGRNALEPLMVPKTTSLVWLPAAKVKVVAALMPQAFK